MTNLPNPRIGVVKCEDKELKLVEFIQASAERAVSSGEPRVVLGIARSPDSPMARAIARALPVASAQNTTLRVVLTTLSASDDGAAPNAILAHDVRIIRDARLLDAHELLVLDATTSWIGDCLRRDPARRDAYEWYAPDCPATARAARISFERIWAKAEPTGPVRREHGAGGGIPARGDATPDIGPQSAVDDGERLPALTRN